MSESVIEVAWDDVVTGVRQIADSLSERPTMLVGIARGGLPILTAMASYLNIHRVGVVGVAVRSSDEPFARRIGHPQAAMIALPAPLRSEAILILDDIVRTGESIRLAHEELIKRYTGTIKSAVLFSSAPLASDYYYRSVPQNAWAIFPWDNWRHG